MLVYISIGIAACNIVVGLVFGLTWVYLSDEIRHSSLLQEEFRTAVRHLMRLIPLSQVVPHLAFEERRTRSGAGAGILREA